MYHELYEKKFGKVRHIPIGVDCQVDPQNIPMITDIIENPAIYHSDIKKEKMMHLVWDAHRLHPDLVQYYLNQMKKLWPHSEYFYQEDIALQFLHLKNYRVEDAILSFIYDREELLQVIKRKFFVFFIFVLVNSKQRIDTSKLHLERHHFNYRSLLNSESPDSLYVERLKNWLQTTYFVKNEVDDLPGDDFEEETPKKKRILGKRKKKVSLENI